MCQLNDAFDVLRKRVPTFAYEKKLSRIDTLKLAVTYIEFMADMLQSPNRKRKRDVDPEAEIGGVDDASVASSASGDASGRCADDESSDDAQHTDVDST